MLKKRYTDDIYLLENEKHHNEFNTHMGENNYDVKEKMDDRNNKNCYMRSYIKPRDKKKYTENKT